MKIQLKNIGKIRKATVELNGITVIAGENDTGKSTVGKALFAFFNGMYNIDKKIYDYRKKSISRLFPRFKAIVLEDTDVLWDNDKFIEDILKNKEKYIEQENLLTEKIRDYFKFDKEKFSLISKFYKTSLQEYLQDMTQIIIEKLKIKDEDIYKKHLNNYLDSEFDSQVSNIYTDENSHIKLKLNEKNSYIDIKNNEVINYDINFISDSEIVYIDDPFVLDKNMNFENKSESDYLNHKEHLMKVMFFSKSDLNPVNQVSIEDKLNEVYKKIDSICKGELLQEINSHRKEYLYKEKTTNKTLNMKNVSSGLKTFLILKKLLKDGVIERKSFIILDEPEIHLHPKWQLIFAKILVLLNKTFEINILLNTHSPYFLDAIETYCKKYKLSQKCKYYLSENKGNYSYITDVTQDTKPIYELLSEPFQELADERYEDELS